MIGLYKYIESPFGEKTYFAGANSGVGFVESFRRLLQKSSLDRLYIIKGGPEREKVLSCAFSPSVPPMQGRVPSIFCAAPIPLRSMP